MPTIGNLPMTFTHMAYLTDDLEQSMAACTALGVTGLERTDGIHVAFARGTMPGAGADQSANGTTIELMTPTSAGNYYSDELARKGPGLHHFGISVPDFDRYLAEFMAAGCVITMDLRRTALSPDELAKLDKWIESQNILVQFDVCYLDCKAIGLPTIEMASVRR